MKKLLLFFISLFILQSIQAQDKILPKIYFGDGTNLPFDKEFDLLIPYKNKDSILAVQLYKRKRNLSFIKSLDKESHKRNLPVSGLNAQWTTNASGDSLYLKVRFEYQPDAKIYSLLKPARSYSIILIKNVPDWQNNLISTMRHEYDSSISGRVFLNSIPDNQLISDSGRAFAAYQEIMMEQRQGRLQTLSMNFSDYRKFYIHTFRSLTMKLNGLITTDSTVTYVPSTFLILPGNIDKILPFADNKGCMPITLKCDDSCSFIQQLLALRKLSDETLKPLLYGRISLREVGEFNEKKTGINKFTLRAKNVEKSIRNFRSLQETLIRVQAQLNSTNCKEAYNCLSETLAKIGAILTQLDATASRLNIIAKTNGEIADKLSNSGLFIGYSVTDINSYVYNFQTRNELAITPVFGYAYYGFQKGFNGFTPYLGFQVNFQAVNRETPFNQIRHKTFLQRFSFTTAWTLASLQEDNKRDDLFDKSSLITAGGIKLSHIVMINVGALWFKKEDPSPLITTKKIAATPILALSLNLEIEKLLNGFTKLIPKI